MPTSYEKLSQEQSNFQGKPDSALANDSNYLGGIAAKDYATKDWVEKYHSTEKNDLKNYVDKQDKAILDAAKEYTNTEIRNINLSGVATTNDLKNVKETLNEKIDNSSKDQKNYTDNKVREVVSDVNENFEDVTSSITKVSNAVVELKKSNNEKITGIQNKITDIENTQKESGTDLSGIHNKLGEIEREQDELFQSVSSGKSKVAGAITDKGISTSATATFDIMANNIRQIKTSGGGIDTSDATATQNTILSGYSAYANGNKIYGRYTPPSYPSIPTYGTDTSGGTATESDILAGKTAYVNGLLLTGTLINNEVTEQYGLSEDNYYSEQFQGYNEREEINEQGQYKINQGIFGISTKYNFIINWVKLYDNDDTFIGNYFECMNISYGKIAPFQLNENETKKYRYSFEELGLEPDKDITAIAIGKEDFPFNNTGLVCISQKITNDYSNLNSTIHLILFCAYGYVALGRDSLPFIRDRSIFDLPLWHWKSEDFELGAFYIEPANKDGGVFAILSRDIMQDWYGTLVTTLSIPSFIENTVELKKLKKIDATIKGNRFCKFSDNDEFLVINNSGVYGCLIKIDLRDYSAENIFDFPNQPIILFPNNDYLLIDGYRYKIDYSNVRINLIKDSEIQFLNNRNFCIGGTVNEGKYIYFVEDNTLKVYKVDWDSETEWDLTQEIKIVQKNFIRNYNDGILIFGDSKKIYRLSKSDDVNNIIGLRYKGIYFHRILPNELSAEASDVTNGKMFIGMSGYPERGTRI